MPRGREPIGCKAKRLCANLTRLRGRRVGCAEIHERGADGGTGPSDLAVKSAQTAPHRTTSRASSGRSAKAAVGETGDVMRKNILTTKGIPVVALGLAAALTFGGGARADQNTDGTRSIDASSATTGMLSNVAVEAG